MLLTVFAAAAALSFSSVVPGTVPSTPRASDRPVAGTARVADPQSVPSPNGEPGLLLMGSTMAEGAGNAWFRRSATEKRADDRGMAVAKSDAKSKSTLRNVLIGVGVFAAAGAVAMIAGSAASGGGRDRPVDQLRQSAGGPKGVGAALVWKIKLP
ncbi:MAG: hypothetical protein HY901_29780 [Deltaproteobacteria bacterium]|nr:hypothetical protein [Deltaproteobacteria bacterium]